MVVHNMVQEEDTAGQYQGGVLLDTDKRWVGDFGSSKKQITLRSVTRAASGNIYPLKTMEDNRSSLLCSFIFLFCPH